MNIGIIGIGNMGRNHLRVCRKLENTLTGFNVTAIYDPAVKDYDNKESFLNKVPDLHGVIVATPSDTHVEICLELLKINSDLKILVEKPIDDDLSKVALLAPYEENITVGHIERFNPSVRKLKALIDSKAVTEINTIRTRRLNHTTSRSSRYVNLDLLVHDIDVACFLIGSKLKSRQIIKNQTNRDGVVDHSILIGTFDNPSSAALIAEASWSEPEKIRTLELVCSEGKYCLDYVKQSLVFIPFGGQKQDINVNKSEPLYEELAYFVQFIRGCSPNGCSIEDAANAVRQVS